MTVIIAHQIAAESGRKQQFDVMATKNCSTMGSANPLCGLLVVAIIILLDTNQVLGECCNYSNSALLVSLLLANSMEPLSRVFRIMLA